SGQRQAAALGLELIALRWGIGMRGIMKNLRKNAFAALHFQWWMVIVALTALALGHLWPFVGSLVAPYPVRYLYWLTLLAIAFFYLGMWKQQGISPVCFFLHPISALLMAWTMVDSALTTTRHHGVDWRGTHYDLEELKRGLV